MKKRTPLPGAAGWATGRAGGRRARRPTALATRPRPGARWRPQTGAPGGRGRGRLRGWRRLIVPPAVCCRWVAAAAAAVAARPPKSRPSRSTRPSVSTPSAAWTPTSAPCARWCTCLWPTPTFFPILEGWTPPRGVLLYGPPGTGKTLVARALAASAARAGRHITFYMRKGGDLLSKWVGESERLLRALFAEATRTAPSIIFFDEIDGLAPVRSSKQDQVHASIVSTLLALMDGLDSRGAVVLVAATNRPDAVDPALRRPGRFDCELLFPLPAEPARRSILHIHTRAWASPPSAPALDALAGRTAGYAGADIKGLCAEAALAALRRTHPQIYETDARLALPPAPPIVTAADWGVALKAVVPSAHRAAAAHTRALPPAHGAALGGARDAVLAGLAQVHAPTAAVLAAVRAAGGAAVAAAGGGDDSDGDADDAALWAAFADAPPAAAGIWTSIIVIPAAGSGRPARRGRARPGVWPPRVWRVGRRVGRARLARRPALRPALPAVPPLLPRPLPRGSPGGGFYRGTARGARRPVPARCRRVVGVRAARPARRAGSLRG